MRTTIAIAFTVVLCLSAVGQTTWHVPADFATPQIAIDSVVDGDTVIVGPGVYTGPLILHRAITVVSSTGPENTHFVGNVVGPAVYVGLPLDPPLGPLPRVTGFRFDGFTLRNALSSGLWIENADGVISNCIVHDNGGSNDGPGGAMVREATVAFERCSFTDNTGSDGRDSEPVGNFVPPQAFSFPASGFVGGLWMSGASTIVTLRNCLVARNQGGDGGDAFVVHPLAGPRNGGNGGGGAIFGGIGSVLNLEHTTVVSNSGGGGGAGTGSGSSPGAGGYGGIASSGTIAISRSIIWGHGGQSVGTPSNVTFSDIEGGAAGVGNISADPLFAGFAAGDFHLTANSPCRDAAGTAAPTPVDFDGHPRLLDSGADMGYDEFATLYDGTGEDFILWSTLDGDGRDLHIKPALGGEMLINGFESPDGGLDGSFPILVVQLVPNGIQPGGVPGFPLYFDPNAILVLHDGLASSTPLAPGGLTFGPAFIPLGFIVGQTLRYQAITVTPTALNGFFAVSRADDILFP